MQYIKAWPRALLTLPFSLRLGGTIVCGLLVLLCHLLTFPSTHNGYVLALPVALTAWMFKKRGLLIYLAGIFLILVVYHSLRLGSLLWPLVFLLSFVGGFLLLFLEGCAITTLRNVLDEADDARDKALEAERRTAIAYEQQYRLNQIKDLLLLNINHELRTPLTTLHGYLELLHGHYEQLSPPDRVRFIELAFHASSELQQLIYQVLDATQINEQDIALNTQQMRLADLVAESMKRLDGDRFKRYTIRVDIPAHLTVLANAWAFHQVLQNLFSNIFKYVPPSTLITISAGVQGIKEGYVCLCVQDEGPGIPPDEAPHLFEQFVRLKRDTSGNIRGAGLGLYISRKLVEAMGGTIWVESSGIRGQGSRFCFTLPTALSGLSL